MLGLALVPSIRAITQDLGDCLGLGLALSVKVSASA